RETGVLRAPAAQLAAASSPLSIPPATGDSEAAERRAVVSLNGASLWSAVARAVAALERIIGRVSVTEVQMITAGASRGTVRCLTPRAGLYADPATDATG